MGSDRQGIGTGLIFITIGVLFMIDRQGYADFAQLWPVIVIMVGLTNMLFPKERSVRAGVVAGRRGTRACNGSLGGLWIMFVGVLLLLHMNHVLTFRDSWPLFIVAGGLGIILSSFRRRPATDPSDPNSSNVGGGGLS